MHTYIHTEMAAHEIFHSSTKSRKCKTDDGQIYEVPWGPGTDNPKPWCCWFCDADFGTYDEASAHEDMCGTERGWACDENSSYVYMCVCMCVMTRKPVPGSKTVSPVYVCTYEYMYVCDVP